MLKFMRNKVVDVRKEGSEAFFVRGWLEDDLYGVQVEVKVSVDALEILEISGQWNHYTTPECPRATPFLQEAVGFKITDEGFGRKVHKVVGRKSCRHYANLLLECCHSVNEAVILTAWDEARADLPDLTLEDYLSGTTPAPKKTAEGSAESTPPEKAPSETKSRSARRSKDPISADGPVIDLHVHSFPASPCSSVGVDDLIEEAKRIGLSGLCLTDHNYVWTEADAAELSKKHDFPVLRGTEITTDQGDVLVFGHDKNYDGIVRLEDLRRDVLAAGGYMIVAHPFRGFLVFGAGQVGLTPEKAMERPMYGRVDAMETLNGKVTEKENKFAADVAEGLDLPVTGGSDAHELEEVGLYATRFDRPIKNENDLLEALKSGRFEPVAFRREKGL